MSDAQTLVATSPPEPSAVAESVEAARSRRRFTESLSDLLAAGNVEAGEELRPVRTKHTALATVLDDGTIRVGDEAFRSLSGAAKAVSGNKSEPGWEFWAVQRNGAPVTLYALREAYRAGHWPLSSETIPRVEQEAFPPFCTTDDEKRRWELVTRAALYSFGYEMGKPLDSRDRQLIMQAQRSLYFDQSMDTGDGEVTDEDRATMRAMGAL